MKLRTKLAVIRYVLSHLRRKDLYFTIAAIAALVMNVVGLVSGASQPIFWIAVAALLIDVVGKLKDFYDMTRPSSDDMLLIQTASLPGKGDCGEVSICQLEPAESDQELGYTIYEAVTAEPVAWSDLLDKWLLSQPRVAIEMAHDHESRVLRGLRPHWHDFQNVLALRAEDAAKLNLQLFNERKAALVSRLGPQESIARLGSTSYFTSLVTNEASTQVIKRKNMIISDLRVLYPFRIGDPPQLQPLEGSLMSNHIGVSLLARTSDGYIVQWVQGSRNQQNRGRLVPTASGSLDWLDIRRSESQDLLGVVRYAMARELREENTLKRLLRGTAFSDVAQKVWVIGFFRWLRRAGKPEFIGITQLALQYSQLIPNWEEEATAHGTGAVIKPRYIRTIDQAIAYCTDELEATDQGLSVPLAVMLRRLRSIFRGELGAQARSATSAIWGLEI